MCHALARDWLFGALLAVLSPQVARAQAATSAREHYDQGLKLVSVGDMAAAAKEFETAYRISPNDVVLYNLGQAYLQLGNPVAALEALEKYVRRAPNLNADRQREVSSLIATCKRRVGRLALIVEPSGSEIAIDGQSLGRSPMSAPIALSVGGHGLTVEASGYLPFIGRVDIEPDEEASLSVQLAAVARVSPRVEARLGQLALSCDLPAVAPSIDGVPAAPTAEPILVNVGKHRVSWARDGYQASEAHVDVIDGKVEHVVCDMRPRVDLSTSDLSILSLLIEAPGAQISVDGRPSPATVRLPRGPHQLLVRHSGYLDWSRTVSVRVGFPSIVKVELRPTAERAVALGRSKSQRNWAYILGAAGLAFLGGGAAVYAENSQRYGRWRNERDELSLLLRKEGDASTLNLRISASLEQAVSIQRRDDLAVGVGVVGVGLLSYAVVSWLASEP